VIQKEGRKPMLFSMHAIDRPNSADKRKEVHPAHLAHVKTAADYGVTVVSGGPLVADDASHSIGSLMILEAADRASVEKFNRADPLSAVWGTVEIRRFDKKQ
jgi:uncharacterized protein YciI